MGVEALRKRLRESDWIVCAEALRILNEPDPGSIAIVIHDTTPPPPRVIVVPDPRCRCG